MPECCKPDGVSILILLMQASLDGNDMTKQMISFTDPQRVFLKREAKRLGISIAELVRRIIDRHIETAK